MAYGDYPAEYNPKVHGPYDPARYYGKGEWPDFSPWLIYLQIEPTFVVLNRSFVTKQGVRRSRYRFRPRRQLIENFYFSAYN